MTEPDPPHLAPEPDPGSGRLSARPVTLPADLGPPGRHPAEPGGTYAAAAGLLLLAPASTGSTWDMILRGYGPDVTRIDRCVAAVSARYRVRSDGYVLAGFSDGASYALSLGVANGDLVDAVLAFSPGFLAPLQRTGRPAVFVSHGTADRVLPVDRCSRRIVPRLRRDGYDVAYEEFAGGHEVPAWVVDRGVAWLDGLG